PCPGDSHGLIECPRERHAPLPGDPRGLIELPRERHAPLPGDPRELTECPREHRAPLPGDSRGLTECPRVRRAPPPGDLLVEPAEGKSFRRRSSYGPAPSPDGLDTNHRTFRRLPTLGSEQGVNG